MEDKINLTEEQERMWEKLSTPYEPPMIGNYGVYGYASYTPPSVGFKITANSTSSIAFGYSTVANTTPLAGIVIGA